MNYGFSIAVGVELVPQLLQLLAQLAIVVDLAVENDPGGTVLIANWLVPAFQINDRKPAHGQAHAVAQIKAVVIGPAVTNGLVHAPQQLAVYRSAVTTNNACYATHFLLSG